MTSTIGSTQPAAFSLPDGIETPALVIDLDVVDRNIAAMASAMAHRGVRLRPHAKTHKSVNIARRQLAAGAAGITVGTIGEAEVMADAGIDDIFIAYPVWATDAKAARLRALNDRVRLAVGVESPCAARQLGAAVRGSRAPLEVLIEVDSGERRTGVVRPEAAVDTAIAARDAGLVLRGLFTHGGHGYRSPAAAEGAARDEVTGLRQAAAALVAAGLEVTELSAGSTPTATRSAIEGVTEERPGTYVFGDRQQVALGSIGPGDVGLVIAATVVSDTIEGQVVVDAGSKVLARERSSLIDGIAMVPGLRGAVIERAYDYHGLVELPGDVARPPLGTVVAIIPNHVCPVVNLADRFVVVRGGAVVDEWPVDARGRNG